MFNQASMNVYITEQLNNGYWRLKIVMRVYMLIQNNGTMSAEEIIAKWDEVNATKEMQVWDGVDAIKKMFQSKSQAKEEWNSSWMMKHSTNYRRKWSRS